MGVAQGAGAFARVHDMDFTLTDDHLALRDAVQRFCAGEYPLHARGHVEDAGRAAERHAGMAELGLLGLMLDTTHGGSGLGPVEAMLVARELATALAGSGWIANAVIAGPLIAQAGSIEQRARWLPSIADGTLRAALACHEADARYDLAHVTTRATRQGRRWRLQGRKSITLDGDAAQLFLVVARTSGHDRDRDGLTIFALDPTTQLRIEPHRLLDGRGAAHLVLDGVEAQDAAIVGREGDALPLIEAAVARAEAALVADCAGALDALLTMTCDHLKTRRQFGKPLASFQVLQHQLAEIAIALEQVESMACIAALACDHADTRERDRLISSAKALAAQLSRRCAFAAIQLHGAMGMTTECAVSRYAKRVIANGMLFGDAAMHLDRVVRLRAVADADEHEPAARLHVTA